MVSLRPFSGSGSVVPLSLHGPGILPWLQFSRVIRSPLTPPKFNRYNIGRRPLAINHYTFLLGWLPIFLGTTPTTMSVKFPGWSSLVPRGYLGIRPPNLEGGSAHIHGAIGRHGGHQAGPRGGRRGRDLGGSEQPTPTQVGPWWDFDRYRSQWLSKHIGVS